MKKIICLLLAILMFISFSACKRAPDTTGDEEVAVAGGESEKITEEDQKKETQSPAENSEQTDNQQPEKETQKQQVTETNKEQITNTETKKPIEQEVPTLKYPEFQELNKQLQKEFNLEGKGYPTDVYLQEYLPLKLGHVTKKTKEDGTCFYNAQKDFITKEPITEQMIEAASKYPYGEYEIFDADYHKLRNYLPGEYDGFQMYSRDDFDSMLSYMEKLTEGDFIVKGHFEQSYGTSWIYHNTGYQGFTYNNYTEDAYTIHNFVIEKIYTDNCEYKVGDTIEVATYGTVSQSVDGFYKAASSTGGSDYRYINFKNASLEERTFVLSVTPKAKEGKYSDIFRIGYIQQNVYENIEYGDEDKNTLAKEILAKYN